MQLSRALLYSRRGRLVRCCRLGSDINLSTRILNETDAPQGAASPRLHMMAEVLPLRKFPSAQPAVRQAAHRVLPWVKGLSLAYCPKLVLWVVEAIMYPESMLGSQDDTTDLAGPCFRRCGFGGGVLCAGPLRENGC